MNKVQMQILKEALILAVADVAICSVVQPQLKKVENPGLVTKAALGYTKLTLNPFAQVAWLVGLGVLVALAGDDAQTEAERDEADAGKPIDANDVVLRKEA